MAWLKWTRPSGEAAGEITAHSELPISFNEVSGEDFVELENGEFVLPEGRYEIMGWSVAGSHGGIQAQACLQQLTPEPSEVPSVTGLTRAVQFANATQAQPQALMTVGGIVEVPEGGARYRVIVRTGELDRSHRGMGWIREDIGNHHEVYAALRILRLP